MEGPDLSVRAAAERAEPFSGHGSTSSASLVPHCVKVGAGNKILGHTDAVIEVEDCMPPAPRYKYGLSRHLDTLDPSCCRVGLSYPREDVDEVINRLVVFKRCIIKACALCDRLGRPWLE